MKGTPEISVVIPTKNGGCLFKKVLAGLSDQKFPGSVEILTIDSGSNDGTVEAAEKFGARVIRVAPGSFNHGLTRNQGIASSSGQLVVLMTQDAIPVDETLLVNLIEPFADPEVAGVYARQIPRPDADAITFRNVGAWPTASKQPRVSRILDPEQYRRLSPLDKYMFCKFDNVCSAVRRKTWEAVPFAECSFGEDLDWGRKVLEQGWKIWFRPQAAVYHSHDRSAIYEYRRHYICHWLLFELFELQTIATVREAGRSIARGIRTDIPYALRHERGRLKKIMQALKIPLLTAARILGEYQGGRDRMLNRSKKVKRI